jgi:protein-tyrosine phosphatase
MHSVLFVCTGNQFRSPIAAEAFREQLTRDGRGRWDVSSAGTWTSTGRRSPREALQAARSLGLDIEDHTTRMLDQSMLEEADLVLVMESGHKESIQVEFPFARRKVHLLTQVVEGVSYDIPDPAGANGNAEKILRDLVELVQSGADRIYRLVENG